MQASAVRLSIEALYQEAEAVVHDETPMLAIIKSFPPTDKTGATLSLVSDTKTDSNADQAILRRIDDLMTEAETVAHQYDEAVVVDKKPAAAENQFPAAPPVPNQIAGADQLNDTELDQLLEEAKADLDAMTPATETPAIEDNNAIQDHENIETVMADIAAAVGVTPTALEIAPATDAVDDDSSQTAAVSLQANPDTDTGDAHATAAQTTVMNAELASFIGDTVRSVLNEELPLMVRAALADALDDIKTTSPAPKAKSATKRKTTSAKKPSTSTKAASKANSSKATAKKKAPKTGAVAKKANPKKSAS